VRVRPFNLSDTYGRSGRTGPMAFPRVVPHPDGAGVIDASARACRPAASASGCGCSRRRGTDRMATAAAYTVVPADRAVPLPEA